MAAGILALAVVLSWTGLAGQAQEPAGEPRDALAKAAIGGWKSVHKKILDMAKDFPEEMYGSRPHPDSRSFAEEIHHVIIGAEMFAAQLEESEFNYGGRVEFYKQRPETRENLVSDLEAAIKAVVTELSKQAGSPAQLAFWLGHQSEHYGKLTAIYRINNLVPPFTRQLQERMRRQQQQNEN